MEALTDLVMEVKEFMACLKAEILQITAIIGILEVAVAVGFNLKRGTRTKIAQNIFIFKKSIEN